MITGLSLFQLLQGPVNTEANGAGAVSADNAATPFAGLLGNLLGTGAAGTAGKTASGSSSLASNLPAEIQASLRSLFIGANLSQSLSVLSPDQSAEAGPATDALTLLGGSTDGQLIPLNITLNLQGQDSGRTAGLGGDALILVRESDLKQLLNGGGLDNSEFSLPVLTLLGGAEGSNTPLSLVPATLTVRQGQAEGTAKSDSEQFAGLDFLLTLVPPASLNENAGMAPQPVADNNVSISAAALIQALDRLTELLKAKIGQQTGQQTLSGLAAGGVDSAQVPAATDTETGTWLDTLVSADTTINTGSTDETNTDNVALNDSPAVILGTDGADSDKITALREALIALLEKLAGNPDQPALAVGNEDCDKTNNGLKQDTLRVLTEILKNAITRAAGSGDTSELKNTLALLNRLAHFEQLTAGEQKKTLESLLKATGQISPPASAGDTAPQAAQLTISSTPPAGWNDLSVGDSSYVPTLKDRAGNMTAGRNAAAGSSDSASALQARLLGLALTGVTGNDNPAETTPADSFGTVVADGAEKMGWKAGEGQGTTDSTAVQDPNSTAISQAARAILSFIASVTGTDKTGGEVPADSRNSRNTAGMLNLQTAPVSQFPGSRIVNESSSSQPLAAQNSTISPENAAVPVLTDSDTPAILKDTSPLSDANAAGKNNQNVDRGAQSPRPSDADQPAPGVSRGNENKESGRLPVSIFQAANTALLEAGQTGKDTVEGSKISVQVSLAPVETRKLSNHPSDIRAAVDYVKIGGDISGNSSKEAPVAVQNIANSTLENLVESWLKSGGGKEELSGKIKGGELAGDMKNEQIQNTFRNELSAVRGTDQKADQAQQPRSSWPINQLEVFEKIANAARLTRAGGTSEISMRLQPDNLGMMRVRLSLDNQHVLSARIQVETHEARSIVESSLHQLKDSLAQQGLKVEKLDVDVRQDQHQDQNPYQTAAGKDGGYNSRARNGFASGQPRDSFAPARTDHVSGAMASVTPLHKYSYSTLEWVA